MKPFQFRLERVLSWRGTQLSLAEAKVEQLKAGFRTTALASVQVVDRQAERQVAVLSETAVSGADLRALEASHAWTVREEKRLEARKIELQQSIVLQNRRVAEVRRGVKLLERLKERKHQSWKTGADHEIDDLAAEAAIAQWRRLNQD